MANPIVTITMEDGAVMRGELYPEIAPNTVRNFISLANSEYYDGLIFHRVIPGFMIQNHYPIPLQYQKLIYDPCAHRDSPFAPLLAVFTGQSVLPVPMYQEYHINMYMSTRKSRVF